MTVKREPVDMAESIRHALDAVQGQIASHGHHVDVSMPAEKILVNGDPAHLQQIISNLLGNAIKYTPDGGRIHVILERDGDRAIVTVHDNGIGMSSEFLGQAFGIFVQAEKALDRAHGGLGVGLALVRRLAELHGGSVEARSPGLGLGSTFVVRLPALPLIDLGVATAALDPARLREARLRRVLGVDDNEDAASTTSMLLELSGHAVSVAADGPSVLGRLDEFNPEAVLIDIGLPGMDGYEVCRGIRGTPAHANALLVAVSGYASHADVDRAQAAGFEAHLTKPATPAQIAQTFLQHDRSVHRKL